MWKTVSARLRGSEADLEAMGESTDGLITSTSKLRDLVMALTNVDGTGGFDIMETEDQFKSIYDIVIGIGERWDSMSDVNRAALLESLAGKQQSNALAAALSSVDVIQEAYETAENSEGSALREQEAYSQGIEYSLNRLSASFQTFSNTVFSSDLFKGLIDSGNSFLNVLTEIIDTLGSFQTLAMGFGIFQGIRGTVNQNASGG